MSILYKPVLIESAEQAEALPSGTQRLQDGREGLAVGWTALVPIEAEEETARTAPTTGTGYSLILTDEDSQWRARGYEIRTRFVTPWEEA